MAASAIAQERFTAAIFDASFDSLPDKTQVWIGQPGSREEGLGRLNMLTPDVVAKAASEIRTGRRTALNWDLQKLEYPLFGRQPCQHTISPVLDGLFFDDVYEFNPQAGSQWDGLRHMQKTINGTGEQRFYGGVTVEEVLDRSNDRIGIHHWAKEGIAGRGVLIDYASWAEKKGLKYSVFTNHTVKIEEIQEIVKESKITFQKGDILLIRIGLTREWDTLSEQRKQTFGANLESPSAGVEATEDVLRFIWDNQIAAVAGDAIGWEVLPPIDFGPNFLHPTLLAGWGMPIGEMFDLEELSRICKEEGRWTFFLSSSPLNMRGGISSPPNCMAVF
ncbi:hypothetical protein DM02DRAFT_721718 [Periconia macrospinosa]|uniref:Cyclase n=1 Tax=Periconia macrospinosa TaxID=97972 RepID=A0A2V1D5V5_9PLEO|nr:hypothetical protein DM02DRAFT_721718 [Periconia macrospinosa]